MDQNLPFSARAYLTRLTDTIAKLNTSSWQQAAGMIERAWAENRQIIAFGNGGSALCAQHYITDWNKGAFGATGQPFRGRTLSDNMGLVTAHANDASYADVFIDQLRNVMMPGDLLVAISGSGNSENVLRAVRWANEVGPTIGVCGFDGGALAKLARHVVHMDVDDMQISEDLHLVFGHYVMKQLTQAKSPQSPDGKTQE